MENNDEKDLLRYIARNVYGIDFSKHKSTTSMRNVLTSLAEYDDVTGRTHDAAATILTLAGQELHRDSVVAVMESLKDPKDIKIIIDIIGMHHVQKERDPLSGLDQSFLNRVLYTPLGGREKIKKATKNIFKLEGMSESSDMEDVISSKPPIVPSRKSPITNLQTTAITLIPQIRSYTRNRDMLVIRQSIIQKFPTVSFKKDGDIVTDKIDINLFIYFEEYLKQNMGGGRDAERSFREYMFDNNYQYKVVTPFSNGKLVRWYNPLVPYGPAPIFKTTQIEAVNEYNIKLKEKKRSRQRQQTLTSDSTEPSDTGWSDMNDEGGDFRDSIQRSL